MLSYIVTQMKNAKLFWSADSDPESIYLYGLLQFYGVNIAVQFCFHDCDITPKILCLNKGDKAINRLKKAILLVW